MLLQVAHGAFRIGEPPTNPVQSPLFVQFREARPVCLKIFSQAPEGGLLQSQERKWEKEVVQKKSVGLIDDNQVGCGNFAECRLKEQAAVADPVGFYLQTVLTRQVAIVALLHFRSGRGAINDSELHTFVAKRAVQTLIEGSAVSLDLRFDNQNSFYQFVRFPGRSIPVRENREIKPLLQERKLPFGGKHKKFSFRIPLAARARLWSCPFPKKTAGDETRREVA